MLLRRKRKKILQQLVIFLVVILVLGYFFVLRPIKNIQNKGNMVLASAKEVKAALAENNIDLLKAKVDSFSAQYQDFEKASKKIYWLAFIPYFADFKNGVEAGGYLTTAVKETIAAVSPYADLIGFKKGEESFVEKSAENRLQTAVLTLDKMLGKIDPIAENIHQAEIRIEKIDPKRYPKKLGKTLLQERILGLKEQFVGLASLFVDAKPLLKKLPEILGKNQEKTYLLLFQNDKELRATGGFLTAYAVFKIKDGKITIDRSADIYSLDNSISVHPPAPKEILAYHKDVSRFYIRDSNLSPDFPTSVKLFNSLYEKSSEKVKYDGIIALDSKILVDMLNIFGDTEAGGVRFSAKIDKRCDCPQVLYQLFDMVDRPVNYVKENRKGILGELMYALFYKAIGFSPSKYWGTLAQTMFKNLQEKHILLYFTDEDLQKAISKLNFSGEIREYEGDYLAVNNVNFAGAKSNLFVSMSLSSKTKGKEKEVTVSYRNPYPHSDCNLERGGLCLNAILRNWIRVYVPKGSKLISFEGSIKPVKTYDELGKTVFEGFLTVSPQGAAKVVIKYTLPAGIATRPYLIQKQPGTYDNKLTVEIDGKKVFNGILDQDKEIK
jgi:hypothetical protein